MDKHTKIFTYYIYTLLCLGALLFLPAREVSAAKATGAKIHFINLNANNDAILLECNGAFGMVDSGEDNGYPDGSSKRYPWRAGIVKGNGQTQNVTQYLKSVGVKRLEFYIGTHPHSDHIGNAHQIIKTFRPKRVYLRPYKDSFITNKTRLWDNLYVYDNTLNAVKEVNRQASSAEDGITLIQYFKKNAAYIDPLRRVKNSSNKNNTTRTYHAPSTYLASADSSPNEEIADTAGGSADSGEIAVSDAAPVSGVQTQGGLSSDETVVDYTPMIPNDTYDAAPLSLTGSSKPQTARPKFTLGDGMTIEIMNYDARLSAPDANYFSLGVKVTANGSTAFLSGDINNYRGDEDRLASQLGHVDILKLGHHGYYGSNTSGYLRRLSPDIAILTGKTGQIRQQMWNALASTNTRTYITTLYAGSAKATVVNMNSRVSTNIGRNTKLSKKIVSGHSANMKAYLYLKNGKKVVGGGFQRSGSTGYYFPAGSDTPLTDRWLKLKNKWYYFGSTGKMATGWFKINSYWYYSNKEGIMQVGWVEHKGKKYYLASNGHMVTGDKKIGRYWYHFRSDGSMLVGWLKNRYYYDEHGRWIRNRSRSGWQKYDKGYKWRYSNGTYAKNTWKTIKGSRYHFDSNGYRATGITKIAGKKYYFSPSGRASTGWQTVAGQRYYFTSKGMCTGFQKIHGKRYYFHSNGTLYQKEGLKTIGGKTYLFGNSGTVATGWRTVRGKRYHFASNGAMSLGWQTIDQDIYYLTRSSGVLTGPQTIEDCLYLFDRSGILLKAPAPGWHSFNGTDYYYFQTEKTLHTGWLCLEGLSYYLDPDTGIMVTGLIQLPDRDAPAENEIYHYYFQPPQGQPAENIMDWGMMVTEKTVAIEQEDGTWTYFFDENGKGTPLPEETPDAPPETPPETPSVSENIAENTPVTPPEPDLTVSGNETVTVP